MGENNFKGTVESLFKGMEGFITSKTVVGDAVKFDDGTIILPLVDVSFGLGAGAFSETNKKISEVAKDDKDFSIESSRKYCESIISLFEELFGEEKTYDIFSGKCNLMKCTTAIKELTKAKLEQDKAFATELKSVTTISEEVFGEEEISLNRQQRRAIERNKKKYN